MELIELKAAVKRAVTAKERADKVQEELHETIREAIKDGSFKMKQIVEVTGLTRSRIYQIRDHRR